MALPLYAEWLANIRGPVGPKGRAGTFDAATAEVVPYETVDITPVISGDEGQYIHFFQPRGLPGTNAVANDTAFATYLSAPDTETRAAADAVYIVYRLYVEGVGYPERIPGACNVFLGTVDPGLAMDPVYDRWEDPATLTLPQLIALLLDSSSAVLQATETRSKETIGANRFGPVDNRPPTMSSLSPSANTTASAPAWAFADGAVTVVGTLVTIPRGVYSVGFTVLCATTTASPSGGVRWNLRAAVLDDGTATNAAGSVLNVTAGMTAQNTVIAAPTSSALALDGSHENTVRLTIARLGTDVAEDTFLSTALLLGVRWERR